MPIRSTFPVVLPRAFLLLAALTAGPGVAASTPSALATTQLTDLDGHPVSRVEITGRTDGRLTLRLDGAAGQRGPGGRREQQVYAGTPVPGDRAALRARHLDLGEVGPGRDTFLLPPGVRLNTFRSVVLWCAGVALPMAGGPLEVTRGPTHALNPQAPSARIPGEGRGQLLSSPSSPSPSR